MASSSRPHAIVRPQRVYDFTAFSQRTPTQQPPGDRLDAQFQNLIDATNQLARAVEGMREPLTVDKVDPEFIRQLIEILRAKIAEDAANAHAAAANALVVSRDVESALDAAEAAASTSQIAAAEARTILAQVRNEHAALAALQVEQHERWIRSATPPNAPLEGVPIYYGAGGPYATDVQGATATSADYSQVSIEWAEHMPDTIPGNILAVNAITGDHWSSRWWAHRAAGAFGVQAEWYMGAWPAPGPPTTPFTSTGDPIPPGAMYWDTTTNTMMVWTGSGWAAVAAPAPAATSSLYYPTAADQTVFPLTAADMFGQTFTLNPDGSNGVLAFLNGVRLAPDDGTQKGDFTVDPSTSTLTLLKPASAAGILAVDVLVPQAQLAPGAVNVVKMKPLVFDGATTVFTLQVVDNSTPAIQSAVNLAVVVDGVSQEPGVDFTATGASITFAAAPTTDAKSFIVWFQAAA
jgi:hypothetical protein